MNIIEQKALDVLNELGYNEFPIPIKKIIKNLKIKLKKFDLGEDISGLLVIENGKPKIGYNSFDSEVRQRFTLAHELGHYILHSDQGKDNIFVDNEMVMFRSAKVSQDYTKEKQANRFAAAILMPMHMIKQAFHMLTDERKYRSDDEIVHKLSGKFRVSRIAMTYRLINLDLIQKF